MRNIVEFTGAGDLLLDRRAEALIRRAEPLDPAPRFEDVCRDFGLTVAILLAVAAVAHALLIVINPA